MSDNVSTPVNQADSILAEHANRADERLETIAKDIETTHTNAVLHIAAQLAEARDIFRYRRDEGGFGGWVKTRLHYSRSTAYNLLSVHERFGGEKNLSKWLDTLPAGILYALASPSTPETVRAELLECARSGEVIPPSKVRRRIDAAKSRKPPAERTDLPAVYRAEKLGDAIIDKLKGTSLASAREQDKLVLLNRGAEEGELKPIVRQLVADASAGKNVSAIAVYMNYGAPLPRDDDDVGANSTGKIAQKDDELEELRAEVEDLRSEVENLRNENADLCEAIEQNSKEFTERSNEFYALHSEVEELRSENAGLREALDEANKFLTELSGKFVALHSKNEELRAELVKRAPSAEPTNHGDGLDIPDFLDRTREAAP